MLKWLEARRARKAIARAESEASEKASWEALWARREECYKLQAEAEERSKAATNAVDAAYWCSVARYWNERRPPIYLGRLGVIR
jgi:hypothetical protein